MAKQLGNELLRLSRHAGFYPIHNISLLSLQIPLESIFAQPMKLGEHLEYSREIRSFFSKRGGDAGRKAVRLLQFTQACIRGGKAMDKEATAIGIDVGKHKLDVALIIEGKIRSKSVMNSSAGYQELTTWMASKMSS
ncbi:hypothetical protein [Rugamonas sp.]|uniref:hypothetical protein n=1 Tax=Rugamonas sp. TaxID=1926287 RepID=UPI0025D0781D|nr:hypothetical protein [Rugamonas sp.]